MMTPRDVPTTTMRRSPQAELEALGRPPRVGDRLGPYRLCFEIASGGMANVYLARADARAGLHRFVALKCIKPEHAQDPNFIEMFFDEAHIASQIRHANVCGVIDFERYRGVYVLAMEFLIAETLTTIGRRLAKEPKRVDPVRRAGLIARMIADAAEGLHAAHELRNSQGDLLDVVHRDVSPDNICVTYDGNIKVVDFGVARAADQRHKTRTGVVKGKYSYIAPEILQGATPDRRADVWGLGVVAWELVTGKRLFEEKTNVETFRAISDKEIPPPSSIRKGVPRAFDEIVLRALERSPDRRYATSRDLGRAMTSFLARSRLAIGMADLADFLGDLFPTGRYRKQHLIEVAEQMEGGTEDPREDGGPAPSSPLQVRPRTGCHPRADDSIPIAEGTVCDERATRRLARACATPEPAPALPKTRIANLRPRWPHVATALLSATLVVVAGLAWADRHGSPPSPPLAEAPPVKVEASPTPGKASGSYRLEVSPLEGTEPGAVFLKVKLVEGEEALFTPVGGE